MLIDSTHRKWFWGTAAVAVAAVALHALLTRGTPGGPTGGSTVGLWYGVVGSALMIYAGLLSALRKVPSWWWIGSRQTWMRGHIWLGLLSGVVILCHSGYRWGGPLEIALWVIVIAIFLTGIYGLVLQQILPRLMRRRFPAEASYEQIPHLCEVLRGRADELVEAMDLWPAGAPDEKGKSEVRRFHDETLRPYLDRPTRQSPLGSGARSDAAFGHLRARMGLPTVKDHFAEAESLFDDYRAGLNGRPEKAALAPKAEGAFKKVRETLIALPEVEGLAANAKKAFAEIPPLPDSATATGLVIDLQKLCQDRWVTELEAIGQERRAYAEQERMHRWLHGWLLLHIPLSLALLVLGTLHAILSLYY